MSEDEGKVYKRRSVIENTITVATRKECPICGCKTVNVDVSQADGYFVEVCLGGRLIFDSEGNIIDIPLSRLEDSEVEENLNVVDCPYCNTGWSEKDWKA